MSGLALLGETPTGDMAIPQQEIQVFESGCYVTFAHPMAPTFSDIITAIPTVKEGDRILLGWGDKPLPVNDAVFIFTPTYFQHWSVLDDKNGVVKSSFQQEWNRDRAFKEHIEACVILDIGGALIPTKITLRGGRATAGREIYKAIQGKSNKYTPCEWAMKNVSEAYARFCWKLTVTKETPKNSEPGKKAFPFQMSHEHFEDMTEERFMRLKNAMNDKDFVDGVLECRISLNRRYQQVKAKAS